MGDEGVKALVPSIKANRNLITLDLQNNKISDKVMALLGSALKQSGVFKVCISGNNYTQEGMSALAKETNGSDLISVSPIQEIVNVELKKSVNDNKSRLLSQLRETALCILSPEATNSNYIPKEVAHNILCYFPVARRVEISSYNYKSCKSKEEFVDGFFKEGLNKKGW